MKNIDAHGHVRGESLYLDDIPIREGTLHGKVIGSPIAHGRIRKFDLTEVRKQPGVWAVITAENVPGENQIGGILPDEPLFAEEEVHFQGQPMALILAETEAQAHAAAHHVRLEIDPLPVVTDPREARAKGMLIIPPRTFQLGDTSSQWEQCAHIITGQADSAGQEHLYIEAQGAYAYMAEKGHVRVHSSTQGPTAVQKTVAKVLGMPMHMIEVDVTRLGGGFGGKEDQATPWAVMAALAAKVLNKPIKLVLHRMDDMRMTGKRHPYSSDFKIGLTDDLKILAYEVVFHQDAGAAADLSPAVMERTLFHCTNSYFIPHVKATAYSCRTHVPPNTAFRGFGGPQGMFVLEAAIAKAAETLALSPALIQRRNLLADGQEFPYGQKTEGCLAQATWDSLEAQAKGEHLRQEIASFNQDPNARCKKGLAMMPVCFGISFTKTHMNQASALVHIYHDGSVGLSTGAVEMGQGVNTKMLQVAVRCLGVHPDDVKLETTNTTRVANTSPTAASAGADLNGKAAEMACNLLAERLLEHAAIELDCSPGDLELRDRQVLKSGEATSMSWQDLVLSAFLNRIQLSQHAFYRTPGIHFDTEKEKGHPFAYHVYGTAVTIAKIDVLLGTYEIEAVHLVHDCGKSMNPTIDLGQIEGGLVQGIGWMTMEELVYNPDGRLASNALSTYKVPDIYAAPKEITVHFLNAPGSPHAIFKSKAVGEPPLMYGIGAYFAIRDAILQAKPGRTFPFSAPMTPEKVLIALHGDQAQSAEEAISTQGSSSA